MILSDNYIIKTILNGNKEGFSILFEIYANKIFYLAMKYTNNREDSDDCVQEVFMKVVKNIKYYDQSKSTFATWVYKITVNYLLDKVKIDKIRRKILIVDNEAIDTYQTNSSKDDTIYLSEIEKLVGEVPYHILFLRKGLGMPFNEIAESLNMTTSKAKHIYYRAYDIAKDYSKKGGMKSEQED